MTGKLNVGILGSSGYGGAGLIRRLAYHPCAEVVAVGSRQFKGQQVAAAWPQLGGFYPELRFQTSDEVIEACEVLFCATPHGATAPLVKKGIEAGKRVLDLSADYRLPIDMYEQWYGVTHPHPELYDKARYGLVEFHRSELKGQDLIAVPGCNSSTAILALAPLAVHGLLGDNTVCNLIVGVSGAGRGHSLGLHYSEINENAKPYKVAGTHRHTAEVERTLGKLRSQGKQLETHNDQGIPVSVLFTPHLVPMTRGILASCTTRSLKAKHLTDESLLELYQNFYKDDSMIVVQEALPQTKAVYGSDRTLVSVRFDKRTKQILTFAATDNLGKGAAGQAVQNFNLMHGFEETLALKKGGIWP